MAADSIGVTPTDTGELLVGRVLVTPVFFESNGQIDAQSQNWTDQEIEQTLANIAEGLAFWTRALDALDTVHTLEFVIDDTFATTPVQTPYEPIDRPSSDFFRYTGDFLVDQGFGDAGTIENATALFNHRQRINNHLDQDIDWSFTIFVVDSSDDPDGFFAPSNNGFLGAFAFPGGLFAVTPSGRPPSTIAHETGHIFYARDEFAGGGSYTDRRGYYNAQNLNAFDNPTPGFFQEPSILASGGLLGAAFENGTSPESTLAFVGWRDSDGDGIFDFADVPLELSGIGAFDDDTSTYRFVGSAAAVPLQNQNSAGNQSDITLNEVSLLEYRLDGGPWETAQVVGAQQAELDVSFEIDRPFEVIELRVRDESIGVTSPVVAGSAEIAGISAASVRAVSFLDLDSDGQRALGEPLLADLNVRVSGPGGSDLFQASIAAAQFDDGPLSPDADLGITLSAQGAMVAERIEVLESETTGRRAFHAIAALDGSPIDRLSGEVSLVAALESPVGEVSVTFDGTDGGSYARIVGFDASGQVVGRVTSDRVEAGQTSTLSLALPSGNIHSVEVFGHAGSSIVVSEISAGTSGQLTTDSSGALRLANLPDGEYSVEITPELVIHDFGGPIDLAVVDGQSELVLAAAERVDSPRHNSAGLGADVDQNDLVTPLDALLVINDIVNSGTRQLTFAELSGPKVDVNNDGMVSPLDALLVINELVAPSDSISAEAEAVLLESQAVDTVMAQSLAISRASSSNFAQLAHFAQTEGQMLNLAGDSVDSESAEWTAADNSGQRSPLTPQPHESLPFDAPTEDSVPESEVLDVAVTTLMSRKIHTESTEPFLGAQV